MPNLCSFKDLTEMEVLAVTNSDAQDTSAAKMSATEEDDEADIIPATLTLKANEKQAHELILLTNECKISAVFVRRPTSTTNATPTPEPTTNPAQ